MTEMEEFTEKYCAGKEFDSCVPCTYYSVFRGCWHPKHPQNKQESQEEEEKKNDGERSQ